MRDGRPLVYLDSGATSHKPRAGARRRARLLRAHNAAVHRGAHQLSEEATDAYESARADSRRLHRRPCRRGRLHPQRHRGDQPRRLRVQQRRRAGARRSAPTSPPVRAGPGDEIVVTEMEHHANLMPWQELCPAHRRDPALGARDRRRPARPHRPRHAAQRAHQGVRVHPRVQRARHGEPRRRAGRAGARGRRARRARRLPVRAAPAASTSPSSASTSSPSPGTRCSARSASACSGAAPSCSTHAAVPHRRVDDRDWSRWRARPTPRRRSVRGRRADGGPGRRPGRCVRLPQRARHGPGRRPRAGAHPAPARRSGAASVGARARPGRRPRARRRGRRSSSTACTPTTSARCSTTAASPCGSGHHCAWPLHRRFGVAGQDPGELRRLQHARRGRRAARRRSTGVPAIFGVAV